MQPVCAAFIVEDFRGSIAITALHIIVTQTKRSPRED